jgi:hypothetical protein
MPDLKAPFQGSAASGGGSFDETQRLQIAGQLERILQSPAFLTSRQSERLLRHLVRHSLEGDDDTLRERHIGVEVFGREPGYDAREDPIVRARANELRKRLARYYHESGAPGEVRLDVPAGSYRVAFGFPVVDPAAAVATGRPAWPARLAGAWRRLLIGVVLLAAGGLAAWLARPTGARELFWRPVKAAPQPVVICAGHPIVYQFSHELQSRIRGNSANFFFSHQAEPLPLDPHERIEAHDIIPMRDQYIGLGSTQAIAALAAYFAASGKEHQVRFGNDISFSDLRNSPAVLVGAFQNRWALEMAKDYRFVFDDSGGVGSVVDRSTGRRWAVPGLGPDGSTKEDYAIASRVRSAKTGQVFVFIAGVTQYGTRAAGEFVTSAELMNQALGSAPQGWSRKNVEVVLHVRVVAGTTESPEIVAVHTW